MIGFFFVARVSAVCSQFDDDVEGTGMGEGEGKKDVTDQIEDEEQLLGLKGDEPDKDQAEEAKELGGKRFEYFCCVPFRPRCTAVQHGLV